MKTIKGIICIILNENNRFLLEQRDNNSRLFKWSWVFPGGSVEGNESTTQTVLREIDEEFGITLSESDIMKIGECGRYLDNGFNEIWFTKVSGIPRLHIKESAGAGWYTLEDIKSMNLGYGQNELVLPVLEDYLNQN